MAVAVSSTVTEIVLDITATDARGQEQRMRLTVDPAATDAQIATFLGAGLDLATNAQLTAEVTTKRAVTGFKSPAVDATETNISEMMEIILSGIDPVTARKVSRAFRIGAMVRAIENYPQGTLNTGNAAITAIDNFLNAHYAFVAPDASIHVGLLAVDTGGSHHITVEDIVDQV